MHRKRAFTLIELLVVIAIIALLVALLLPAIGKARKSAFLVKSMANIKQLGIAVKSYQDDYKGLMPVVAMASRGIARADSQVNPGVCTWAFAGKNCKGRWTPYPSYDVHAADRPLNAYLTPEIIDAPAGSARLAATAPERNIFQLEICKDPSDRIGHQQNYPNENTDASSCYDDVGTSYQSNLKWLYQPDVNAIFNSGQVIRAMRAGSTRMGVADSFQPSRFVWVNDEWVDIVLNNPLARARIKNGYDDINRGCLGYMDGHANYLEVFPGGWIAPNGGPSFNNDKYTFVFEGRMRP